MSSSNWVKGSGKVFFNPRINGILTGERLIAETPEMSYVVKTTFASEDTSDGPVAVTAWRQPIKIESSGTFKTKDISDQNLALYAIAEVSSAATAAASVTGDAVNGGVALLADRWYQLGDDPDGDHPYSGVRAVEDVVLKHTTTTFVADTDYILDPRRARFYVPVGSPMVGQTVTADYDTTAVTWSRIVSDALGKPEQGLLHFISNNAPGAARDFIFPDVIIGPNGSLGLKDPSKGQELGFEFSINIPAKGSAVYIDGLPA